MFLAETYFFAWKMFLENCKNSQRKTFQKLFLQGLQSLETYLNCTVTSKSAFRVENHWGKFQSVFFIQ